MGIFSEIDMENRMKQEQAEAQAMTASELAAQRDEARQAAEAAEAQKMLVELNETNASPAEDDEPEEEEENSLSETIQQLSEDEKRKAHEEAEAKRKTEWEARKRKCEEADTMAWEAAIAMDDDALMEASSNRLAADAERITRRNMKQCVTEYVQALCFENLRFAQQVMHPRKSMINCFKYINRKAMEFVKQEMEDNGIKPTNEGYGCDIPDDLCYQWAVNYFNDMEAPEDKKEGEEDFVPKPYTGSTPKNTIKSKTVKKTEKAKKTERKSAETNPAESKSDAAQSEGQLSIFNMGV